MDLSWFSLRSVVQMETEQEIRLSKIQLRQELQRLLDYLIPDKKEVKKK